MPPEAFKKPAATVTANSKAFLEEDVRSRAFELYEKRGREDGHEVDDWLSAEAELIEAAAKAAAKTAA